MVDQTKVLVWTLRSAAVTIGKLISTETDHPDQQPQPKPHSALTLRPRRIPPRVHGKTFRARVYNA